MGGPCVLEDTYLTEEAVCLLRIGLFSLGMHLAYSCPELILIEDMFEFAWQVEAD